MLETDVANSGTVDGNVAVLLYSASHPVAEVGPAWGDAQITKISWDNKMYMNVYIVNDLFADGTINNSGVASTPGMALPETERVVYNGAFLPGNSGGDIDFTSVITHEFGHYLNLMHAFNERGLSTCDPELVDGFGYGDRIADTPQMECSVYVDAYWGHGKKNCVDEIIDFGNFMNYGVYCNFTKDQVAYMKVALTHPMRKPLWQQSNLDKVLGEVPVLVKDPATFSEKLDGLNKK